MDSGLQWVSSLILKFYNFTILKDKTKHDYEIGKFDSNQNFSGEANLDLGNFNFGSIDHEELTEEIEKGVEKLESKLTKIIDEMKDEISNSINIQLSQNQENLDKLNSAITSHTALIEDIGTSQTNFESGFEEMTDEIKKENEEYQTNVKPLNLSYLDD